MEANCDDDGIEFELEEMDPVKETATEAEDEKSVTDTEPVAEDPVDVRKCFLFISNPPVPIFYIHEILYLFIPDCCC